ncbi:hypothetical protein [Acetobacter persici]|uniref:hypothetical protein n=1 Tax=Acetobacter persici TaxID=1076596 RepID=UPI0012FDDFFE|nr:hypothetical protein [Acetobacter persici]
MTNRPILGENIVAIQSKAASRTSSRAKGVSKSVQVHFETMDELKRVFPKSFPKNGSINLKDRRTIVSLPPVLRAAGTLTVSGCSRLEYLPASRDMIFQVEAEGCTSLKSIDPDYAAFEGVLYLNNCPSLECLPEGMRLKGGGSLFLENCTALKSLPDGLEVDGKLAIDGCTGLTELPENLKAGFLYMQGCTNVKALPATLHADIIYLKGCDGIQIPQELVDRMDKAGFIFYPDEYEIIKSPSMHDSPCL